VRVLEWGMAVILGGLGVRSLWIWSRRRFEGQDITDHLLYALFLTGRIGLWFAFAGLFVIYATNDARALVDESRDVSWYAIVLLTLSAVQFVAGQMLARRGDPRGS
jgi:hypothetical protein